MAEEEQKSLFLEIAEKWQKKWAEDNIFKSSLDPKKKKFYCLEMYPYPSGKLHMGHVRNYSLGDCFARYKRMNGLNVLYPMGFDSFGLPAENAAIKNKTNPREWTEQRMKEMMAQQKSLGLSYDWSRMLFSHDPEYYRWNQWFFIQMLKKGLAYKKTAAVNWCPKCNTVLANEQVHDGKCWRHEDTEVEPKELSQWYLKITDYADELLRDIEKLEHWPERVKAMQKNWIGKSKGTIIRFDVVDESGKKIDEIETFTTRPDTIFGITYLVLAAEHPKCIEWTKDTQYEKEVKEFIQGVKKRSIIERTAEGKEKNGAFLGKYFINPANGKKYPLWVADYALMEYGTGAVMAVPTHDQRDFEFAKKYDLPLIVVINPLDGWELDPAKMKRAFVDEGKLVNSGDFDGMHNRDAIEEISRWIEEKGYGKRTVNFKLRDWLISRQRYWGTPIPIIYCDKCGAVPDENLPVRLPDDVDFSKGGNPLETSKDFVDTKCPCCGADAKRETDTMDTFVDSSWYFLKYTDSKRTEIFDKKETGYWMAVDQYIGGIEHACMHLIYARFFTKALRDLGMVDIDEPFSSLLTQGMVTLDGEVMSKSKGNVVDPGEIISKYGPDTARVFILFAALPEKQLDWDDNGAEGSFKFLKKVHALNELEMEFGDAVKDAKVGNDNDRYMLSKLHKTIRDVTEDMDGFRISLAIGKIMQLVNDLQDYVRGDANKNIVGECVKSICLLLCPVAPHISEELWQSCGMNSYCSLAKWPECNEDCIDDSAESSKQMIVNTISDIRSVLKLIKADNPKKITLFVSEGWKYDFFKKLKQSLENTRDIGEIIRQVLVRGYEKEISRIVPSVAKNQSKMPLVVLSQSREFLALELSKDKLEQEFGCEFKIIKAEESPEQKAKQALPGKPSIIVE
jgi:leucyl-tRNA synthetase